MFAKLVNKNAIKHQKGVPSPQNFKIFTTLIYPPSQNLAKTSWTLPQDFQTVCICVDFISDNFLKPSFKILQKSN
jgi:hypothetical protein